MLLCLGDCLTFLRTLPAGGVDAVIADPPYGMTHLGYDQHKMDWAALWPELERVTKPNAVMALFSAQPFTTDLIESNRKHFRYDITWCKTMGTRFFDCNRMPLRAHESILIFSPIFGGPGNGKVCTYNPQKTPGKPYFHHHVSNGQDRRAAHYNACKDPCRATHNLTGDRYPLDWLVVSNRNFRSLHHSQKPLELIEWLVLTYSNPGETVLDFVMGSGTTGVACVQHEREFIGCELDDETFIAAEKRIREAGEKI